ncbi:MAG: methyltransferase domain-containing protein [Proteobacteria bacterium]|nr:methyltransferase domain-containing protein [Pseudomonadota bacterium]
MAKVSDYYDAVAGDYFRQYQRSNLHTSDEYPANYFRLQILVQRIARADLKSVYEVGVGGGTPLAAMAAMGLAVAGCDISDAMVRAARETFARHGLDADLIRWGDIEDASTFAAQLKERKFDAVIAAGVLPHIRNDGLALDNIGMIVRSGGRVLIEFRNKLFSLFTLNRLTKEFILDDLLAGVRPAVKDAVAQELNRRLAVDLPPKRTHVEGGGPGYDAILSRFHNPFELLDLFKSHGYRDPTIHWYHYHAAPPMLEGALGTEFRAAAMALEHEGSWRGWFLCSAGVIEAVRE